MSVLPEYPRSLVALRMTGVFTQNYQGDVLLRRLIYSGR